LTGINLGHMTLVKAGQYQQAEAIARSITSPS
jgi:hypothetical protein